MSGFWSPPNNPFTHPYGRLPYWREPISHRYSIYQFFVHIIETLGQFPVDTMTGDDSDDESIPIVEEQDDSASFQQWFENDGNVTPTKRIQYLVMMMIAIDPTFTLDVPPFSEGKKRGMKPTLDLYKKEVRQRNPKAKVSRNKPEVALLLRDDLPLTDPEDIEYVKKIEQHKEKLCQLADEKVANAKTTATRITLCSLERMRFVECMVLDSSFIR
jgi:hypothetical protein